MKKHTISDARLRELLGEKYNKKTKEEWTSWLLDIEKISDCVIDELSGSKKQFYARIAKRTMKGD